MGGPIIVATWDFGLRACDEALPVLISGGASLDAIERGIRVVEDDTSVESVGYGGDPNSECVVELDAAVMSGPGRRCGGVIGVRDIREAISVARCVMERTDHCMLVGEGARQFALAQGFEPHEMLTDESRARWQRWKQDAQNGEAHDTVCVLALDRSGDLCAGTSTSGTSYKLPGRAGDTALFGCGLYCDNGVGAAAATGYGENIMRYTMSFRIVDEMRRGASPEEACRSTLRWAIDDSPESREKTTAVIALDRTGRWGAASIRSGFSVAVGDSSGSRLIPVDPV